MTKMPGRPGTSGGLVLRAGQFVFAAACICAMASAPGFTSYTAFCYLIASMGLQALWSLGLACLDCYALILKRDLQQAFFHELICCWRLGSSNSFICCSVLSRRCSRTFQKGCILLQEGSPTPLWKF